MDLLITSTPYTLIDLTGAGLFYGLPHFVRFSFAVFDRFYVILPFTSVNFPHDSVRRGTVLRRHSSVFRLDFPGILIAFCRR